MALKAGVGGRGPGMDNVDAGRGGIERAKDVYS